MRRLFTLDRVPVWAFGGLMLLSWGGAAYYVPRIPVDTLTPFTWVWAAYEPRRAGELVSWVMLGLGAALWLPMGRAVTFRQLGGDFTRMIEKTHLGWLLVAILGLILLIYVKGSFLLSAPAYLNFMAPTFLVSAANILAPVCATAIGITSLKRPLFASIMLLTLILILFAYSTRVFAGVAILFLLGRVLGGRAASLPGVATAVVYTFLALPIPLMNRGQIEHGLIPYLSYTREFVLNADFLNGALSVWAQNVGFSVPLMEFVGDKASFPSQNLFVSINPLPANVAGWDQISSTMRVHYYIPYSMLGEIATLGGPALSVGVMLWGCIVRFCLQRIVQSTNPLLPFFTAAILGLSLMSVVYAAQYNTRSVSRLLWVMVAILAIERGVRLVSDTLASRRAARSRMR